MAVADELGARAEGDIALDQLDARSAASRSMPSPSTLPPSTSTSGSGVAVEQQPGEPVEVLGGQDVAADLRRDAVEPPAGAARLLRL